MMAIIDYGLGNVRAFANVYKNLNIPCKITEKTNDLADATKIILPGVGAFDHAMELLQESGMTEVLDELVLKQNVPVLGICVGMQMLAFSSEEGKRSGLGWIDGTVKRFDTSILKSKTLLPHMGWNTIHPNNDNPLLVNFNKDSRFYFLHSYYFRCNNPNDTISTTEYGIQYTSAINNKNIYGVQFHPEKSHQNGIQLLRNFAEL